MQLHNWNRFVFNCVNLPDWFQKEKLHKKKKPDVKVSQETSNGLVILNILLFPGCSLETMMMRGGVGVSVISAID